MARQDRYLYLRAYHERTDEASREAAGGKIVLRHRPLSVMACCTRFRGHLPNGHIVPALLSGKYRVIYASRANAADRWVCDGFMARSWRSCWRDQLVPRREKEQVSFLADAKGLDGVLFTGSANTGHILHPSIHPGQPGKMLALEMGARPMVIQWPFGDADATVLEVSIDFIGAGQRWLRNNQFRRIPVGERRSVLDKLVAAAEDSCWSAIRWACTLHGPTVSEAAARFILRRHRLIRNH